MWLFTAIFLYTQFSAPSTKVQPQALYKINIYASISHLENSPINWQPLCFHMKRDHNTGAI